MDEPKVDTFPPPLESEHATGATLHERTDVSARRIVRFTILLSLLVVAILVGVAGIFRLYRAKEGDVVASPHRDLGILPDWSKLPQNQPRLEGYLEELPSEDSRGVELERRLANQLHSYGWVDVKAGTVHVPIERAMALIATKLPVRATDNTDSKFKGTWNDASNLLRDSSSGRRTLGESR